MLIGEPRDVVLRHFASYLRRENAKVVYINQHLLGKSITLDENYWYLPDGVRLAHLEVLGVYNRSMGFSPLEKIDEDINNTHAFVSSMLDHEYVNVVNRPFAMLSNNSKPLQAYLLRDCGLDHPESICVANSVVTRCSGDMIYKSICAVRSVVSKMERACDFFVKEPLLLQQTIAGYSIRVHVVGSKVFASKITAKKIDYRYCRLNKHEVYDLPSEIERICKQVAAKLHLWFCGIDLIFMNGKYYLLEVNTAPGYNYYERRLPELEISKALYKLLMDVKDDTVHKQRQQS